MADPKHPADALYEKLDDLFGTSGDQMLVLEWPARVLDETSYAYPLVDSYSALSKPTRVAENEFRLTNGLLDVARIVGGTNGEQLSEVYNSALNQLVPSYSNESSSYQGDKETLRSWLLETITAEYDDDAGNATSITATRVEVYAALSERYERALASWGEKKNAVLGTAEADADRTTELEKYSRWLVREAPAMQAELEAKFADLVVKGYYHEVREAIASLDITTPGEALERSKAHMRASGWSSMDESMTIYPVQLQPADWFRGLTTDFQAEDLLLDPALMQSQLISKRRQMTELQSQITFLRSLATGNAQELHDRATSTAADLSAAMTRLNDTYTANTVTVARMYLDSRTPSAEATFEGATAALQGAGVPAITPEQWGALQQGLTAVSAAQDAATAAGQRLADLQAAEMAAKTTDKAQAIVMLATQYAALRDEVERIEATLFGPGGQAQLQKMVKADGTYDTAQDPNLGTDKDGKPTYKMLPTPMPSPGQFFDVVMAFSEQTSTQSSDVASSASNAHWRVNAFFGGASGDVSSSSSDEHAEYATHSMSFQIGFRAMKVGIDRGGWFNPGLFGESGEMYHLLTGENEYQPVSYGAPSRDAADPDAELARLRHGVFPAFPVSFLVAKDVTIKISLSDVSSASDAHAQATSASGSGGIFCFSGGGASSSSSSTSTASSSVIGNEVIIKIPGPQILGWFVQFTHADESAPYREMPAGYLPKTTPAVGPSPTPLELPAPAPAVPASPAQP